MPCFQRWQSDRQHTVFLQSEAHGRVCVSRALQTIADRGITEVSLQFKMLERAEEVFVPQSLSTVLKTIGDKRHHCRPRRLLGEGFSRRGGKDVTLVLIGCKEQRRKRGSSKEQMRKRGGICATLAQHGTQGERKKRAYI